MTFEDDLLDKSMRKPSKAYLIILVISVLSLMTIGLTNLCSADLTGFYFNAQIRNSIMGLICFILFGWVIPLRLVNLYAYPFFVFILISLVAVLVMGDIAGGAQRWINLGFFRFQPSEVAKLAVCLAVAKFFFNGRNKNDYTLEEIMPILACIGFLFIVIFKQPDFGTAGVCLLIPFAQLFFIKVKIHFKTLMAMGFSLVALSVVGWMFFLRPYQKQRVLTLIDPSVDPTGSGYNALQSLVAVGSGDMLGKGYGQGTQAQLQFLPARHTDFIFSVFAEEHGFWGCLLVFILFGFVTYIALEIAREAKDIFESMLSVGMSALIFIQFAINVAMVMGIFPVVGMPLPFFSYGGSSLLTSCIAAGLLVSIERNRINWKKQLLS